MSDSATLMMRRPAAPEPPEALRLYRPGLDGVRAVAVLLVVVYHIAPSWLPGGFLGVDVFFVLSGWLITDLLCAERQRTGRIDLARFWVRRARRLLPALVVLLVTVTAAAALWRPERIDASGRDVLSALTFTNNWWQISTHASYFASFGPPPLFQHLWTLGVEEQFYLAWPLVILGLLRMTGPCARTRIRVAVVPAAVIASLTAMALLHRPGEDTSRAYFGTDTHAFGLLLGAALALAVPAAGARNHHRAPLLYGAAGVMGSVVLAVLAGGIHSDTPHLYPWGFAVAACAAGAVVLAAAQSGSVFARFMSTPWLRWIGRRSYGIYLWHMPLIALAVPDGPGPGRAPLRGLLAAAVSVAVAAASYRWVEKPVRRHGLRRTAAAVRGALSGERGKSWGGTADRARVPGGDLGGVGGISRRPSGGPHGPGDSEGSGTDDRRSWGPRAVAVLAGTAVLVAAWGIASAGGGDSAADRIAAGERAVQGDDPVPPGTSARARAERITAVGDSVMLAAAPALKERFPGIKIDAKVSRQLSAAPSEVRSLGSEDRLNPVLLVGLGTNGVGGRTDLEQVVREAGARRTVVLVTVHGPLAWKDQVNTAVRQTAAAHPNVVVADWDRAVRGRDDLLADDGVHPGPAGARLYAGTVARALEQR
ncbi:acyltransferase family protein [Streptomyces sp. NPDC029044]|uniref:acyltransferase family protein n=1 Tax=Streptomyces sp. NPDC029044 TaxID=3157198 RepID=UPI0033FF3E2C